MQALNPLAIELNEQLRNTAPAVFALLSELGERIYLPKGILSQTAEANTKAHRFNATRAIALDFSQDAGDMMHLPVARGTGARTHTGEHLRLRARTRATSVTGSVENPSFTRESDTRGENIQPSNCDKRHDARV